jgi:hypothetical protein
MNRAKILDYLSKTPTYWFYEVTKYEAGVPEGVQTKEDAEIYKKFLKDYEPRELEELCKERFKENVRISKGTIKNLRSFIIAPHRNHQEELLKIYSQGLKGAPVKYSLMSTFHISWIYSLDLGKIEVSREFLVYPYSHKMEWLWDIKNFEVTPPIKREYKPKKKVKCGERMRQTLEILGISSLDELSMVDKSAIENLEPYDFISMGFSKPATTNLRTIIQKLLKAKELADEGKDPREAFERRRKVRRSKF